MASDTCSLMSSQLVAVKKVGPNWTVQPTNVDELGSCGSYGGCGSCGSCVERAVVLCCTVGIRSGDVALSPNA